MFISYQFQCVLGYDEPQKRQRMQYKIVDSEIGEIIGECFVGDGVSAAVIDTYESRNLPVAANLIKSLIWQSKRYHLPVSILISEDKKYRTPKFTRYAKDLEKYLILL